MTRAATRCEVTIKPILFLLLATLTPASAKTCDDEVEGYFENSGAAATFGSSRNVLYGSGDCHLTVVLADGTSVELARQGGDPCGH
jgi:hypothetical protein